ncbi:SNF1-related protein kinase regulatory subunit gamma-1 [Linum grandiflorum]
MQEPQKKRMELGGGEDHAKDIMDSNFMTDLKHQQQQETTHQQKKQLDSGAALQAFLDHIPINAIPGIQNSSSGTYLFFTFSFLNAVIQLLLQSAGLEWFDAIADRPLSEYREEHLKTVYGDQSLSEALHLLWKSQVGVVAVVSRGNGRVIGCIRNSDAYLLVENTNLFSNRKSITAEEFIHTEAAGSAAADGDDPTIQRDLGALLSAGTLKLKNAFLPKMDSVVTNKRSDTLKQAMVEMAKTNSSFSFLVDASNRPTGILTSRDVIVQFAPPCMDSSFQGGGFFDFALEQAGCSQDKNGTVVCNRQASSSARLVKATDTAASSN